jgi:hypothetical protein
MPHMSNTNSLLFVDRPSQEKGEGEGDSPVEEEEGMEDEVSLNLLSYVCFLFKLPVTVLDRHCRCHPALSILPADVSLLGACFTAYASLL